MDLEKWTDALDGVSLHPPKRGSLSQLSKVRRLSAGSEHPDQQHLVSSLQVLASGKLPPVQLVLKRADTEAVACYPITL